MLRNYFLIAIRSLHKNLGYTLINVFGLAVGLASCLLVTLYVRYELSYEKFHANKDSIYRYIPRAERDGTIYSQTYLPAGFAPLIASSFPEVEMYTRFTWIDDNPLLKNGDVILDSKSFCVADPDFFQMFSFHLQQGDPKNVLTRPFTIAIAKSVADSHFPDGNALGKILRYDNEFDFEITGVFEDVPANSHLQFTYLTSFETMAKIGEIRYDWPANDFLSDLGSWNYSAYFYIPTEKNIQDLATRIDKKFTEARQEEFNPNTTNDWLQPLNEIHFTKGIKADSANGDINYVYLFAAVALIILLIACFNFMNLSTARAMKRAKEVGLRKVMGAFRPQLIKQFMGETIMLVAISLVIGVILLELMVPLFNSLIGQHLKVTYFGEGSLIWFFMLAGLITGVLAGSYPAFYLSSFSPAKVLKGQLSASGNGGLRRVLTSLQFGVATFLMIGTFVVYQQMSFIQNSDLGFDQEKIIYMNPPTSLWEKREVFKGALLTHSSIESVTFSNRTPGMQSATWQYAFPGQNIDKRSMNTIIVDHDYMKTFGLEIVDGRAFSTEFATDSTDAYIVNEAAVEELMMEKPVGSSMQALDGHEPGHIIGVVKNFHYRSLHRKIEPLVIRMDSRNMWCTSVKFGSGNLKDQLATVEKEWKKIAPEHPFTYTFVDDTIEEQYKTEQNTGVLIGSFSALAIIIACLGLLGLTAFMTEQRKKEIGVRKVLGASVSGIIVLLSRDFSRLVLLSFVVVVPIAWYAMNQWLADFAYKIDINPLVFLGAGLLILLIAFLSVFYQAFKAAVVNPSETLRNE